MTDSSTHLYSPGLVGIIATESSVSNINGEKGILSYRGYSIEELAQKSTFEETSYLLLFGELPNPDQLKAFTSQVTEYRKLPNELITILKSLPKNTKPMDVLQMAVSSLGTFYDLEVSPEKVKTKKYDWIKTTTLKIIKARTYFFELFILFVCQDKIGAILINKKPGIIIGITVELK